MNEIKHFKLDVRVVSFTDRFKINVSNLTTDVDMQNVLIVFDRVDENSLVAGAVAKKFTNYDVIDLERVEYTRLDNYKTIFWIGYFPEVALQKRFKNKNHIVLTNQLHHGNKYHSAFVISNPSMTLTELVICRLCSEFIHYSDDEFASIDIWSGVSHIVSTYTNKDMVYSHDDNSKYWPARAYENIESAYRYLYLGDELKYSIDEVDVQKYDKVMKTVKMLLKNRSSRGYLVKNGRMIPTIFVDINDQYWYPAKRWMFLSNRVWATPVISNQQLMYGTNLKYVNGISAI